LEHRQSPYRWLRSLLGDGGAAGLRAIKSGQNASDIQDLWDPQASANLLPTCRAVGSLHKRSESQNESVEHNFGQQHP
jgi:hypothetical protein